jgi:hypothetical protein
MEFEYSYKTAEFIRAPLKKGVLCRDLKFWPPELINEGRCYMMNVLIPNTLIVQYTEFGIHLLMHEN